MIRHPISLLTACMLGVAALLTLSLGTMGVLLSRDAVGRYQRDVRHDLQTGVDLAADRIGNLLSDRDGKLASADAWASRLSPIARRLDMRVTLIEMDGQVLYDSTKPADTMANHADRVEVADALRGQTRQSSRFSAETNVERMYLASPVVRNGTLVGVVRTSRELAAIQSGASDVQRDSLWVGVGVFVMALLAGVLIVRRLTQPLSMMTTASRNMQRGQPAERIGPVSSSIREIDELYTTFCQMQRTITQQVETMDRQRKEKMSILESLAEGVLAINTEGNVVDCNVAMSDLLDVEPADLLQRHYSQLGHLPELPRFIDTSLDQSTVCSEEIHRSFPTPLHLLLTSSPLKRDHTTDGVVIVANDITRLKQLEHVRQEFVANVSHELKTPLTTILGFAKTLAGPANETCSDADRKRFLKIIHHDGQRALAIIDDLLLLSQLDAKESSIRQTEPVELDALLRRLADQYKSKVEAQQIALAVKIETDGESVFTANESLLQLAVDNLVRNAIRHTPPGGSVRLELASGDDPLTARPVWKVSVQDTGCGIEPRFHQSVFQRFFRVDTSRERDAGGTGLGLALVKHIARAHNGRIDLTSAPGEGSRFTLLLPRS